MILNFKKIFYLFVIVLNIVILTNCSEDNNPVNTADNTNTEDTTSIWNSFNCPKVTFSNYDSLGNGKYYTLYFSDPVEQISSHTIEICKILYKNPEEAIKITKLEFRIEVYENGVAYTTGLGAQDQKRIVFSSDYLIKQINSKSKNDIIFEIQGVIAHEMTHVFQQSCEYANDGWSAIEGMADAVRYLSGYDRISRRKTGGSWTDGYTTTGFFIIWLQENKDPEFVYNLNQYIGKHYSFSWQLAAYSLLDESIENLWTEYQNAIK